METAIDGPISSCFSLLKNEAERIAFAKDPVKEQAKMKAEKDEASRVLNGKPKYIDEKVAKNISETYR